ncbi:hypothetical protein C8F01DRAFT_1130961 [Mycena amicta]|nr:hypothetical protein C8F01DRAFT_1130961 [Mycena amicta]
MLLSFNFLLFAPLILLHCAIPIFARPFALKSVVRRLDVGDAQCFTERSASADACHALLNSAANLTPDWTDLTESATQAILESKPLPDWTDLSKTATQTIFRPFCNGSCCLFTDTHNASVDALVEAGTRLLSCEQPANGVVSGATKTSTAGVCIADDTAADFCLLHLR